MAERKRPEITETVEDLSGQKILVIKADGKIVGVQNPEVVAKRLANVASIIESIDTGLAMSDAEHLAAAEKRIDEHIENLTARKTALTAEGVTATAKARLQEKRLDLVAQQKILTDAVAEMAGEVPAPTEA
jgi:hypothetical protein